MRHPRYPAFAKDFDEANGHVKINECPVERHVTKQKHFIRALGFIITFVISPLIEEKRRGNFVVELFLKYIILSQMLITHRLTLLKFGRTCT